MAGLVAKSSIEIAAPADRVWKALTDPALVKQYYFGTTLETSWRVGEPITFSGEWQGRAYRDHGTVKVFDAPRTLSYTHFSPLMGKPDTPENYHLITITLSPAGSNTRVNLEQDNNASEEALGHSKNNWDTMLSGLKQLVERQAR